MSPNFLVKLSTTHWNCLFISERSRLWRKRLLSVLCKSFNLFEYECTTSVAYYKIILACWRTRRRVRICCFIIIRTHSCLMSTKVVASNSLTPWFGSWSSLPVMPYSLGAVFSQKCNYHYSQWGSELYKFYKGKHSLIEVIIIARFYTLVFNQNVSLYRLYTESDW